MKTKIKFFETDSGIISVQTTIPTINGVEQPMELVIAIEREGKDLVFSFNKEQSNALFREMKLAVSQI